MGKGHVEQPAFSDVYAMASLPTTVRTCRELCRKQSSGLSLSKCAEGWAHRHAASRKDSCCFSRGHRPLEISRCMWSASYVHSAWCWDNVYVTVGCGASCEVETEDKPWNQEQRGALDYSPGDVYYVLRNELKVFSYPKDFFFVLFLCYWLVEWMDSLPLPLTQLPMAHVFLLHRPL